MRTIIHFTLWVFLIAMYVFGVIIPITIYRHASGWLTLEFVAVFGFLCWGFLGLFWDRQRAVENFEAIGRRFGKTKVIASFWTTIGLALAITALVIRHLDQSHSS